MTTTLLTLGFFLFKWGNMNKRRGNLVLFWLRLVRVRTCNNYTTCTTCGSHAGLMLSRVELVMVEFHMNAAVLRKRKMIRITDSRQDRAAYSEEETGIFLSGLSRNSEWFIPRNKLFPLLQSSCSIRAQTEQSAQTLTHRSRYTARTPTHHSNAPTILSGVPWF